MKRILIFSHALELGGAERALLGLLENFDYKNYDVDLFLMRHEGELLPYLPQEVHLLPELAAYTGLAVPIGRTIKRGLWGVALGRLLAKIVAKFRIIQLRLPNENDVELQCSHKYTKMFMPHISDKEYDLAISFLTPHYFVPEKVIAKKKMAWIHTDYSTVAVDKGEQLKMWEKYDYIASISESVTDTFTATFPTLERKIVRIENIQPVSLIRRQANEPVPDDMICDESISLLSIGRFCPAKNFDNIPDICRRILAAGVNVKWYLIGFGGDEPLIRNRIIESGMEKHVVILGKKTNPYPYIKACDLYVQPSRYEGKCVSVKEAQLLGKPVVITNYATAASQLEDGVDGIIVPMDNQGCADGIVDLIRCQEKINALSRNCDNRDYTNFDSVYAIYNRV